MQKPYETNTEESNRSHATVNGGHANVDRLSNNVLGRLKQFGKILKKVAERSGDSSRWSRDRRQLSNNVFGRFKRLGNFLKKVAELSRDSGRRSRDRRPTVKQRFWTFQAITEIFWKKSLNGHATVVGGHATVGRLSNNVFWTFQRFLTYDEGVYEKVKPLFWKKSLNGHATVVGGHATVGRLSNNVFWRFKQLGKLLKKVAERSRDSGRRSRDRRPTVNFNVFSDVSSVFGFQFCILKKVAERSRDSGKVTRPSADWNNVFLRRFKHGVKFFVEVAERSRDVVGGHATVGDCQTTCFGRFNVFWKKSLNGHATVVEVTRSRLSNNVFWTKS